MSFQQQATEFSDPEKMAAAYLAQYYGNTKIEYPINPFQMLKDEGVLFSFMKSDNLEGAYIPASSEDDIPIVGINVNRPITRQRFTAAHELCHHFRDANSEISCPILSTKKNDVERFADGFAGALLMPMHELRVQVNKRKNARGEVSFDDALEISVFFGVSFEACVRRIAYKIYALSGDVENEELKKRIKRFGPDKERKKRHIGYAGLYAGIIDCYQEQFTFTPTDRAKYIFQNEYIYNDSRMEGLDVTPEQAADIVTDLRLNAQNSIYCTEGKENEPFMSIAGHYCMYQAILATPVSDKLDVYDMFDLNRRLFSRFPHPEYGGQKRENNTLVIGAKFETIDYADIFDELDKLNEEVKSYFANRANIPMSEYIKAVARTHHKITVIHPFQDGNGRTSRAFMNVELVRAGILPIYIKVDEKPKYIEALAEADLTGDYNDLYEIIYKHIFLSFADLIR